jgi:hypothetical protein
MSNCKLAALTGLVSFMVAAGCASDSGQPKANAGADMQVSGLTFVTLHGTGKAEHGGLLNYQWIQTGGAPVVLTNAHSPEPTFIAPNLDSTLVFELTVTEESKHRSDSVAVHVASTLPQYDYQLLSSTAIAGGGADRALHSVYDADLQRLYVVNATDRTLEVFTLADPAHPLLVGSLDLLAASGASEIGAPTSIALSRRSIAVAIEASPLQAPGILELWDTTTLLPLGHFPVGPAPRSVVFTPDETRVMTVNEGDPSENFLVDPEGSVSIVQLVPRYGAPPSDSGMVERATSVTDPVTQIGGLGWAQPEPAFEDPAVVPAGPTSTGAATGQPFEHKGTQITTVNFHAFDAQKDALIASGVRILGPHATVSEDLEPVSIALNAAGTQAWVMCEENNAMALLDLEQELFVDVRPLGFKTWNDPLALRHSEMVFHAWDQAPVLAPIGNGLQAELGGFTGLSYIGESAGVLHFWAIPDRGPTLLALQANGDAQLETPFAWPQYPAKLVALSFDPATHQFALEGEVSLLRSDEYTPISGLPNLLATTEGLAFHDGQPVDTHGAALPLDPFGADFGAVVQLPSGQVLLGDRYRPSLYLFSPTGTLQQRYVPVGSNGFGVNLGKETLPAVYAQRRAGTGFDGVAYDPIVNKAYAFMGAALDNPDDALDSVSKQSRIARILELELPSGNVTGEYVYVLEGGTSAARIAEAVWDGPSSALLVLEVNDQQGAAARNVVNRILLANATNLTLLSGPAYASIAGPGGVLETTAPCDLAALVPSIVPVHKDLATDLAAGGCTVQYELQGFMPLGGERMLLVTDNEFGLHDAVLDLSSGGVILPSSDPQRTVFTLVHCPLIGLDASDQDAGISIRDWPVRGMYMPDAMVRHDSGGFSFLLTANEGQPRDHYASHGVVEERRVSELQLDPSVFPAAAGLQQSAELGRLMVSGLCGDSDADGFYEELWSFGGRSFAVWSPDGEMLYDSGDTLERMLAAWEPELFNSDGTQATFDTRSDDRGAEPKSLAVGDVNGTPYVFVGLEEFCGVAVFDLSIPTAPSFACFLVSPLDRGAHGLVFVEAAQSSTGRPLLVSTNSLSGSVAVFELDF